jgi:MYXO-CTERM domain-containing protein
MLSRSLLAASIFALAVSATMARADPISFGYDFTTPQAVTGDAGNLGTVAFATTNGGTATGPTATLTAASVTAISAAPNNNADTFSGETYNVTLALTDTASGKSGSLTFVGKLFGSLTATTANITTSFAAPTQTLVLGSDRYTVRIGPLVPPTTANPTVVGTLMTTVAVEANGSVGQTSQTPEPSGLVLAGLGLAAAALVRRRGRRAPAVA